VFWNILQVTGVDQGQVWDPVYYIRYMGWFRMAIIHTKRIRMKLEIFCIILQVAGVDQGQVGKPSVLHQEHRMLQDDLIKMKRRNVLEHTTGCWN
jgi:hypothetical protein